MAKTPDDEAGAKQRDDGPPTNVDEVLARLRRKAAAPTPPPPPEAAAGAEAEIPTDGEAEVLAQAAAVIDEAVQDASLERLVSERTDDLQRLQAEYANYRKRVERDRATARQQGVESVVRELMPVWDAIAQAASHDELNGGFKVVATEFQRLAEKLGLKTFGAIGDEFDPNFHDALMQLPTADVEPGHVAQVIQLGYRLGDTVLRPARVAVASAPPE